MLKIRNVLFFLLFENYIPILSLIPETGFEESYETVVTLEFLLWEINKAFLSYQVDILFYAI